LRDGRTQNKDPERKQISQVKNETEAASGENEDSGDPYLKAIEVVPSETNKTKAVVPQDPDKSRNIISKISVYIVIIGTSSASLSTLPSSTYYTSLPSVLSSFLSLTHLSCVLFFSPSRIWSTNYSALVFILYYFKIKRKK
jgi:hypothetical protein